MDSHRRQNSVGNVQHAYVTCGRLCMLRILHMLELEGVNGRSMVEYDTIGGSV